MEKQLIKEIESKLNGKFDYECAYEDCGDIFHSFESIDVFHARAHYTFAFSFDENGGKISGHSVDDEVYAQLTADDCYANTDVIYESDSHTTLAQACKEALETMEQNNE